MDFTNDFELQAERWNLLNLAQEIMPFGNPIQKCQRVTTGKVKIIKKGDRYEYRGLVSCGSSWSCPICSPKKAAKKARAIREMHKLIDYDSVLVSYTVQHNYSDSLKSLIDILYSSLRRARSGRAMKRFKQHAHGYIRSTEITYSHPDIESKSNGWHPHIHEVIYLKKGSTIEDITRTVVSEYERAVEKSGKLVNQHTVDAKKWDKSTDYITKNSDIDEVIGWLNKKGNKSVNVFGLLRRSEDSDRFADLYKEYYYSTKGRKITMVSRSLSQQYKKAIEKIESEMDEEEEVTIKEIEQDTWKQFCALGIRWQLLFTVKSDHISTNLKEVS